VVAWLPLALAAHLFAQGAAGPASTPAATVVYLARHAEKVDDSRDPALSPAGEARARELARLLGNAGITHVWSTDFQRTRHTAGPIAAALDLQVRIYNPSDLAGFAAELRRTPGRHLVIGHSNTTPGTVEALGGDPGPLIPDTEYDRLYLVVLAPGATTVMLRFGAPAP
jgi:phosphohistidine phosphatase SixA